MKDINLQRLVKWADGLKDEELACPNYDKATKNGKYMINPQTTHIATLVKLTKAFYPKTK